MECFVLKKIRLNCFLDKVSQTLAKNNRRKKKIRTEIDFVRHGRARAREVVGGRECRGPNAIQSHPPCLNLEAPFQPSASRDGWHLFRGPGPQRGWQKQRRWKHIMPHWCRYKMPRVYQHDAQTMHHQKRVRANRATSRFSNGFILQSAGNNRLTGIESRKSVK